MSAAGHLASILLIFAPALTPAPAVSIRQIYDGTLELPSQVEAFRHIDTFFPSRLVRHGSPRPLLRTKQFPAAWAFTTQGRTVTIDQYMDSNRVAGLLVLKNGKVAIEKYRFGNTERTRWVSWSIAKSITSTLVAAALTDGSIRSLDDNAAAYLPRLAGTAWDGVSVRNILQMASGVQWNETYTNPRSDRRQMLDAQIAQRPGAVLEFLRTRPRAAAPGTVWKYSTGETQVLGALLSAAVRKPLSEYLSEKIWSKLGMESDATWWLDSPGGVEVGGSGFSATLRDYGRFAQFVLEGGRAAGQSVVPAGWFPDAGQPKRVGSRTVNYGYMWWNFGPGAAPVHDGAFYGLGIFGQYLYINPRRNVAIVVWSARQSPAGSAPVSDYDFLTAAAEALANAK